MPTDVKMYRSLLKTGPRILATRRKRGRGQTIKQNRPRHATNCRYTEVLAGPTLLLSISPKAIYNGEYRRRRYVTQPKLTFLDMMYIAEGDIQRSVSPEAIRNPAYSHNFCDSQLTGRWNNSEVLPKRWSTHCTNFTRGGDESEICKRTNLHISSTRHPVSVGLDIMNACMK